VRYVHYYEAVLRGLEPPPCALRLLRVEMRHRSGAAAAAGRRTWLTHRMGVVGVPGLGAGASGRDDGAGQDPGPLGPLGGAVNLFLRITLPGRSTRDMSTAWVASRTSSDREREAVKGSHSAAQVGLWLLDPDLAVAASLEGMLVNEDVKLTLHTVGPLALGEVLWRLNFHTAFEAARLERGEVTTPPPVAATAHHAQEDGLEPAAAGGGARPMADGMSSLAPTLPAGGGGPSGVPAEGAGAQSSPSEQCLIFPCQGLDDSHGFAKAYGDFELRIYVEQVPAARTATAGAVDATGSAADDSLSEGLRTDRSIAE